MQACEAATSSLSRPGSPRDMVSQSISERELLVRAKLQDLMEQVRIVDYIFKYFHVQIVLLFVTISIVILICFRFLSNITLSLFETL